MPRPRRQGRGEGRGRRGELQKHKHERERRQDTATKACRGPQAKVKLPTHSWLASMEKARCNPSAGGQQPPRPLQPVSLGMVLDCCCLKGCICCHFSLPQCSLTSSFPLCQKEAKQTQQLKNIWVMCLRRAGVPGVGTQQEAAADTSNLHCTGGQVLTYFHILKPSTA